MSAWIIKTETYDPDLALEIVQDQQTKGYTAWIEDEHGNAVDEEALRMHKTEPTKLTLAEKWKGLLVGLASAAAAIGILMWPGCGLMVGIKPLATGSAASPRIYLVSERTTPPVVASEAGIKDGEQTMKKLLIAAGFLAIATSTAWAQVNVYPSPPYGYAPGYYSYRVPYAPQPYAAPPGFYGYYSVYGFDPTANNWDYYRVDSPGRGNDAESQR